MTWRISVLIVALCGCGTARAGTIYFPLKSVTYKTYATGSPTQETWNPDVTTCSGAGTPYACCPGAFNATVPTNACVAQTAIEFHDNVGTRCIDFEFPYPGVSVPVVIHFSWHASATSGVVLWSAIVTARNPAASIWNNWSTGASAPQDRQSVPDNLGTASTVETLTGMLPAISIARTPAMVTLCRISSSGSDTMTADAVLDAFSLTY